MILTKTQAETLQNIISKNEAYTALANQLQKAIDGYQIEIGHLLEQKHCEHDWEEITKEMVKKIGIPSDWKEKYTQEELAEIVACWEVKCRKCGLRYEHRNLNIDNVISRYKETFCIDISVSHQGLYKAIEEEEKEFHRQTREEIKKLEKAIKEMENF